MLTRREVEQFLIGVCPLALAATAIFLVSPSAEATSDRDARRCSMSGPSSIRDSAAIYLVGTATADTVLAGPGSIGRALLRGARPEPDVYGQLVRADTFDGIGASRVRTAFNALESRGVVIVPWGYGADCRPEFWRRSARWVTPDSSGLFSLYLRPDSLWVAGRPTFDAVYAAVNSYVQGATDEASRPPSKLVGPTREPDRALTPAEVFEIYMRLPTRSAPPDTAALARLREWLRANPEMRTRYPGNDILWWWRDVR